MQTTTTGLLHPESPVDDRAPGESSSGNASDGWFDLGVAAPSFRLPRMLLGRILEAEATNATSVWFSDELLARTSPSLWHREGGPFALVSPDPHDVADPFVVASAGLLASRRTVVGVHGVDVTRRDPADVARTTATIADLAPGRFVVGLRAGPAWAAPTPDSDTASGNWVSFERVADTLDAIRRLVGPEALVPPASTADGRRPHLEVVVEVPTVAGAELAGRFGVGWLPSSTGLTPLAYAEAALAARTAARAAGHQGVLSLGLLVEAVVHEDPAVVADALGRDLVRAHLSLGLIRDGVVGIHPRTRRRLRDWTDGRIADTRMGKLWRAALCPELVHRGLHGSPKQVAASLQAYVDSGVRRIVLRNLVSLGRPDEAAAGDRATAATLRLARLNSG